MDVIRVKNTEIQLLANESLVFQAEAAKNFRWKMTLKLLKIYAVVIPIIFFVTYYFVQRSNPNFYSEFAQSMALNTTTLNVLVSGMMILLILFPSIFWGFYSSNIRYYCTNTRCIYFNKLGKDLRQVSVPYQEISSIEKYQDRADRWLHIFTVILWLGEKSGGRKPLLICGLGQQDVELLLTRITSHLQPSSTVDALIPKLNWKDKAIFPRLNWKQGIFSKGKNTAEEKVWPYVLYYAIFSTIFLCVDFLSSLFSSLFS